jgi:hypothetical protein
MIIKRIFSFFPAHERNILLLNSSVRVNYDESSITVNYDESNNNYDECVRAGLKGHNVKYLQR